MKNPQRIYLDCTTTYFLGMNTGIQRVVRNLANRSKLIAERQKVECIPVVAAFGNFWSLSQRGPLTSASPTFARLLGYANRTLAPLLQREKTITSTGKQKSNPGLSLELANIARKFVYVVGSAVLYVPFFLALAKGELRKTQMNSDDVLLMADAFWFYDALGVAERLAARGIRVISVIYDLIPITHPEFCSATMTRKFQHMIPRVLKYSSGIIVTAKTIRSDLNKYIENHNLQVEKQLPIDYFYLGSDFYGKTQTTTSPHPRQGELDQILTKAPSFLMVGTIEPRKGYEYVLDAFSAIWEEGSEYQLIIVGREGWKGDVILEKADYYTKQYGKVFTFHDLDDEGLKYLYENCVALIFASEVEGFGLPLVEAIQAKLPVLTSDIPIFREIGGEYPDYFSLKDPSSLLRMLEKQNKGTEKKVSDLHWPTWDESVLALIEKTLALTSGFQKTEPRVQRSQVD